MNLPHRIDAEKPYTASLFGAQYITDNKLRPTWESSSIMADTAAVKRAGAWRSMYTELHLPSARLFLKTPPTCQFALPRSLQAQDRPLDRHIVKTPTVPKYSRQHCSVLNAG